MDPNEALAQLRKAATDDPGEVWAVYFEGLDQWLSRGGFLPNAWGRQPAARLQVTEAMLEAVLAPSGTTTRPAQAEGSQGRTEPEPRGTDTYTGPTFREDES